MFNGRDYIDYTFLVAGKKKVGNTSASMLPKHKEAFEALTVEQKETLRLKALAPFVPSVEEAPVEAPVEEAPVEVPVEATKE